MVCHPPVSRDSRGVSLPGSASSPFPLGLAGAERTGQPARGSVARSRPCPSLLLEQTTPAAPPCCRCRVSGWVGAGLPGQVLLLLSPAGLMLFPRPFVVLPGASPAPAGSGGFGRNEQWDQKAPAEPAECWDRPSEAQTKLGGRRGLSIAHRTGNGYF